MNTPRFIVHGYDARVELGVGLEEVAVVAQRLGPVRDAALGAEVDRVAGDAVLGDAPSAQPVGEAGAELGEVRRRRRG